MMDNERLAGKMADPLGPAARREMHPLDLPQVAEHPRHGVNAPQVTPSLVYRATKRTPNERDEALA